MSRWDRIVNYFDSRIVVAGFLVLALLFIYLLSVNIGQGRDLTKANGNIARQNDTLLALQRDAASDRDYLISVIEKMNAQVIALGGQPVVNVAEVAAEVTRQRQASTTAPRRTSTTTVAAGPRGEPGPVGPQGPQGEPGEDAPMTTTTSPSTTTTTPQEPCPTVPVVGVCNPVGPIGR